MTMPETIWAWCFQVSEDGGWGDWGGYARQTSLFPLDDRERKTGDEYVLRSSVQGMIDAAFRESAAMAIARSGEGSGPMPHPYDKGYVAACKDIANAIRTKIGGSE